MTELPKKPQSTPKPPPRPWRRASFSFGSEEEAKEGKADGRTREVSKGLEAIYLQDGEKKEDLKTLSHTRRSRAFRIFAWVVGGCALASALAWLGLFLFIPNGWKETTGLALTIDGPATVSLGREETFVLSWSNPSFQPVRDVEIRLSVPPEFLVSSVVPPPPDRSELTWKLGLVPPNGKGTVEVKGVFLGALGDQSALQVVGTYLGNDDAKPHQALVTRTLVFGESVLAGTFRVPAKAVAGDTVPIEYAVVNRGSQGLRGLRARIVMPKGFSLQSSTGSSMLRLGETDEWEQPLGDLAAGTTSTIRLNGSFVAGSAGDALVTGRIGVSKPDGSFLPLLASSSTFPVLAGDLGLHLVGNGGDGDRTVAPGDPLRITLEYQNLSPEPLSGVRLELSFESLVNGSSATGTSLLDWTKLEDSERGASSTKTRIQKIVYDQKSVPAFERLAPQERGTIDVTLPTLPATSGTKDAIVRIGLQGTMAQVGKDKSTRIIRTSPLSFRYRSDLSLQSEARYFTEEGAPVGSGPLPPVAGKATGYRVIWTLSKTLHEISDLEVSAVLPASVSLGANSSTDAGVLSYDPASRTVRWNLNRMPEGVNELLATFDILLTPTEFDIGRFAQLLGESRLTSADVLLSESVVRAMPPLSTDLQNDDGARSKGVVKKK